MDSSLHYLPLTPGYFSLLVAALILAMLFVQLRVLRYAYLQLGLSPGAALLLLMATLIGSYFNIPIAETAGQRAVVGQEIDVFGMHYQVPILVNRPGTVIAVNVGGAAIPALMSLYLLMRHALWLRGAIATAGVAAFLHWLATPVPGLGIAVPVFAPALGTAAAAVLLSRERAAALAYIAGSLGTLIGADLMNLGVIGSLGAPVASIGGAGTFDGIFLTGILAVLLASFWPARAERT